MEFSNSVITKALFRMYGVNIESAWVKGDNAVICDIDNEGEKLRVAIENSLFTVIETKPKGVITLKLNESGVVDLAKSMDVQFFNCLLNEIKIDTDKGVIRYIEHSMYSKIKEYIYGYIYGKRGLDEICVTIENFHEFMNPPMVYKLLSGNQVVDRAFNVEDLRDNSFIVKDNLIYLKSDCYSKEIEEAIDFGAIQYLDKKSGWRVFEARNEKFVEFLKSKLSSNKNTNYPPLCSYEEREKIEEERISLINLFNEIEYVLL